ncbi:hypothetical protein ABEB36_013848 [Hypothenemus hampei]|uniref:Transposable element P transposase-like C-terminal domain-containing protein n=1 Tax=Hypothenemus hampei TaxID=57062 RepID=A0ABD1E5F7_HYPHA
MLFSLRNLLNANEKDGNMAEEEDHTTEEMCVDFPKDPSLSYLEQQALNYVLGFVMKKVKPILNNCNDCFNKLLTNEALTYVSPQFQKEMASIYVGFKRCIQNNLHKKKLLQSLLQILSAYQFTCEEHLSLNKWEGYTKINKQCCNNFT